MLILLNKGEKVAFTSGEQESRTLREIVCFFLQVLPESEEFISYSVGQGWSTSEASLVSPHFIPCFPRALPNPPQNAFLSNIGHLKTLVQYFF